MGVIIPIVAAGLGAAAGGLIGSWLSGSGQKQEAQATQYSPTIAYPYAQYSPSTIKTYQPTISEQLSYLYSPTINISSPYATGATQTTKQDVTQEPKTTVTTTQIPSITGASQVQQQEAVKTDNWMQMLLIGGLALAGVYLITRKK